MAIHASHAATPPIRKARWTLLIPYLDADGDPTDPTSPDTELSLDGGAAADAAEEVATFRNSVALFTLSGAEMDGSTVSGAGKGTGPKTTLFTLYPLDLPIIGTGTLAAGSAGGGTLGTILPYDLTGCYIRSTGGTGGGGTGGANNQARRIVSHTVATGAFTVSPNWETTPSTDTTYDLLLPPHVTLGMLKVMSPGSYGLFLGTATAGAAGSITLPASASAIADIYRGMYALIVAGTGAGQAPRFIYAHSTGRVSSVSPNWTTTPDSTSQVVLMPAAPFPTDTSSLPTADLSAAGAQTVWDRATTALSTAGSIGKRLADEVTTARMAVLTDLIDGGRLDLLIDAIKAKTDLQASTIDGLTPLQWQSMVLAMLLGVVVDPAADPVVVRNHLNTQNRVSMPADRATAPTLTHTSE